MSKEPSPKADRLRELHQQKIERLNAKPRANANPKPPTCNDKVSYAGRPKNVRPPAPGPKPKGKKQ